MWPGLMLQLSLVMIYVMAWSAMKLTEQDSHPNHALRNRCKLSSHPTGMWMSGLPLGFKTNGEPWKTVFDLTPSQDAWRM